MSAPPLPGLEDWVRLHEGGEPPTIKGEGKGVISDIAASAGELTAEPEPGEREFAMFDMLVLDQTVLKCGPAEVMGDTIVPSRSERCSEMVGVGAFMDGGGERASSGRFFEESIACALTGDG